MDSPDTQRDAPTSIVGARPDSSRSRVRRVRATSLATGRRLPRPRHLPRPLGRPDHRAQPAPEVPHPPAAPGDLPADAERLDLKNGEAVRVSQNGTSVEAAVLIKERVAAGSRASWPRASPTATPTPCSTAAPSRSRSEARARSAPRCCRSPTPSFAEATWIMVVKSLVIFAVIFGVLPILTVVERKLIGRFQHRYGPNRVGPFGLLQPLADVGKLDLQGVLPARRTRSRTLFILGPLLPVLAGVLVAGDHPLGRRPGRGRPLRDRRPDRDPLLLRRRLDRLLRPAARRLVLGLEIQPPRGDALGRAADLLRGLDGPGAARRGA